MYERVVLVNGVRVVGEVVPYVDSVSIGLWVGAGSREEERGQEGASHLIEHMFFKGTARRTARDIAEEIDAVGGQLNAFTTREYTCFYAKTLGRHLGLGLELLSDMFCGSRLEENELEKEKGVILEEIKSYEDSPDELVHDLFASSLWPDHPLGRPILGTPSSVMGLGRGELQNYLADNYRSGNIVLAVAGNVDFAEVCRLAETYLSDLSCGTPERRLEHPVPCGRRLLRNKEIEQVHLCLGGQGVERCSPDKYAVYVMDSILGGSVSSRLFQSLREERGLVYATGSTHSSFRDAGLFTVYAGSAPDRAAEVLALILAELHKLAADPVGEAELNRAKEQLRGNFLLSMESTSTRMSRIAKAELFTSVILTPDEVMERIEAVNASDVMRVAQMIFTLNPLAAAAVAPLCVTLDLDALMEEGVTA